MQINNTLTTWLAIALLGSLTFSEPVMAATNTYCFGRYLIDVPSVARLMSSDNSYITSGEIKSEKISHENFYSLVESRELLLKNKSKNSLYVFRENRFSNEKNKRIIISVGDFYGSKSYELDAYKFVGDGFMLYKTDQDITDDGTDKIIAKYEELVKHMRYRPKFQIPVEPGFCFENGFIPDKGETGEGESAMLFFTLKSHPDVAIQVRSAVMAESTPSLLERSRSGLLSLLDGTRTLRKGDRVINGVAGEELLIRSPRQDGVAHKFRWETMGKPKSTLKPNLFVDLQTGYKPGGYTTSSVSDKEAIAIFDQIVQSIRLRSTN